MFFRTYVKRGYRHGKILNLFNIYFIVGILVWGGKTDRLNISEKTGYLSRLNSLRGLFALDILIGHVAGHNMYPLMPFEKFSIVSVAGFFFLSGAGLADSYYKKKIPFRHSIKNNCTYSINIAFAFHKDCCATYIGIFIRLYPQ